MITRIILAEEHAAAIRAAAAKAYPLECCGLLVGDNETVTRIVAAPNTAPNPARHFEIDPQILFDHMRSARESNTRSGKISLRLLGHYHSHPNGIGEPSAEDARMAHDPEAVWIIAAVNRESVVLRAFVPDGAAFKEIPIL